MPGRHFPPSCSAEHTGAGYVVNAFCRLFDFRAFAVFFFRAEARLWSGVASALC